MNFTLTDEQLAKLNAWLAGMEKPPKTAIGGSLTYSFTSTSLGLIVVVKNWDGQEIDLSDYDSW